MYALNMESLVCGPYHKQKYFSNYYKKQDIMNSFKKSGKLISILRYDLGTHLTWNVPQVSQLIDLAQDAHQVRRDIRPAKKAK